MSILTKIFVVLVSVMSVALVALVVPFVAKVENYKAQLEVVEASKIRAEATARQRQIEIANLSSKESERIIALGSKISNLTSEIANISEELDTTKANLQSSLADKAKNDANISRLTASNNQLAAITRSLQNELKTRREQTVQLQTRSIQLTDRNNEVESQNASLAREIRKFSEQLTAAQERNSELESMFGRLDPVVKQELLGTNGQATASKPFMPAHRISGEVRTSQQVGDETFVEINVGKNDGVEPNMKFWVHRGATLVGTLLITRIDNNVSSGRMLLLVGKIATGDKVLTGGFN